MSESWQRMSTDLQRDLGYLAAASVAAVLDDTDLLRLCLAAMFVAPSVSHNVHKSTLLLARDVQRKQQVCKTWQAAIDSIPQGDFWRNLCKQMWPASSIPENDSDAKNDMWPADFHGNPMRDWFRSRLHAIFDFDLVEERAAFAISDGLAIRSVEWAYGIEALKQRWHKVSTRLNQLREMEAAYQRRVKPLMVDTGWGLTAPTEGLPPRDYDEAELAAIRTSLEQLMYGMPERYSYKRPIGFTPQYIRKYEDIPDLPVYVICIGEYGCV